MKPLDFDQALADLDKQERMIAGGVAVAQAAVDRTPILPFWPRVFLRWKGQRVIAKGTRHLLRIRAHRDWMLEQEETLRPMLARRAVWAVDDR